MSSSVTSMSRKGKWTTEEEALTARIIHYFSLGVLQLPEGTTLRAYLAQKLDCDPMRITKKFTGTNCLGKRVYHSCERTTATYEVAKQAVEELAELESRFRSRLERNKEKRTGIMDIEARLLGNRSLSIGSIVDTKRMSINGPPMNTNPHSFGQAAAALPASMPPNANNVAAAAAAAAAAAWNPLAQGYALPPGYAAVTATQGVFGRPAVSGIPVTSPMHGFGLPRVPPPSPGSSGHPHQLTATVLHSHQLHLQQFAHAPGVAATGVQQAPVPPCPMSKTQMAEATAPAPGSPPGSRTQQAYLATAPGQMPNPYWAYPQGRGEYPDYAAAGTGPHGYPTSPAQAGSPHLGMLATTLQHQQQWMHQQRHHGGAAVPANVGGLPWQYPQQHHLQQQQLQQQHTIPPSLKVLHISAKGENNAAEESKESAGTTPCSGSSGGANGSSTSTTTSTACPHVSRSSSTSSETSCTNVTPTPSLPARGATSADAAAVGSAEGDTVSSMMASPRELQQMYKSSGRSKSGRRRHHHRGSINGEASSTVSAPRSNTTRSSGSTGSTTADGASSLGSISLSGSSSTGGSRTGSGSDERQSKSGSSCGSGKGDGGEGGAGVSSISCSSGSDSGSEEQDKQTSPDATDDSQDCRSTAQRMDVDGAGGLLMGFIESLNKKHMLDQQQQQQNQQAEKDGVLQQQRSQEKQQQEQLQQKQKQSDNGLRQDNERPQQHHGKHPSPQYRPKPPSPHAFPRVRHKHAARLEMEARLASSGSSSSGSISGEGASSSSAKKPRVATDLNKKSMEQANTHSSMSAGGSSGITSRSLIGPNGDVKGGNSVREAVPPPRNPSGIVLPGRPESRKRPRDQPQQQDGVCLIGMVAQATSSSSCFGVNNNRRRNGNVDASEEGGSSIGYGSVSSEGGNSEEGGYEEDRDGVSWGSSGKDSGSFEGSNNDASVSEADYGACDERSSSFDERDQNDNDGFSEENTTPKAALERTSSGIRDA